MFLGIEIGGTKLQLAVGKGDGSDFAKLERLDIDTGQGAAGILAQIEATTGRLIEQFDVAGIGIGFGGPVDSATGCVVKSHQVDGWENFPLGQWCREKFDLPTTLGNDCDVAALAEARCGAGRGSDIVFFVTVGTGVGGGLVVDGKLHGRHRPASAEVGHLRPGLAAIDAHATVESLASGRGIEATARQMIVNATPADEQQKSALLDLCENDAERLSGKMIAQAAMEGNELARRVLDQAFRALGWGIAQVVTLLAPQVVVVGGGVSLIGDEFFFNPLRREVKRYVFPPLADAYKIVPAALGEQVVVHGALSLAAESKNLP